MNEFIALCINCWSRYPPPKGLPPSPLTSSVAPHTFSGLEACDVDLQVVMASSMFNEHNFLLAFDRFGIPVGVEILERDGIFIYLSYLNIWCRVDHPMLGHFDSFQPEILGNPPPSLDSWRNYVFAFGVVKVPEEAFILGKEAVGTWDHCRPGLVSAENWKKNSSKLKETFSFPQYPIFEEDSLDKPLHFCEEMSLATISGRTISPSQRVVRDT